MKPETAAKKLGIFLPAAPQEFQDGPVSRDAFNELQSSPPEWLVELRTNGPHPRPVIAHKLNISNAGLLRGGITEALTTVQIKELLEEQPAWLVAERAVQAQVRAETKRIKDRDANRRQGSAE
jgi:hypothetical protein